MRILSLCGLLGYGYDEASLKRALDSGVDVIGVDAGSTDPGPHYLGSGTSFTGYSAVKRDLSLALPEAVRRKIPFIIGSAGGAGSGVHVAWCKKIIEEIASEHNLRFSMGIIETDVSAEYVKSKMKEGKIREMQPGLELSGENIDKCTHIVSQIGVEPFINLLKHGVDLILAGRSCDTSIYAAPALLAGCGEGASLHMAKIMECGALCTEPMAAADCMLADIEGDSFILEPPGPDRRCTVERAAAHAMYEQDNPYLIYEPGGAVDLRSSKYEQINPRMVRVSNSKFNRAKKYTLKLEGSMPAGYRTICIAQINDPQTIAHLDELEEKVRLFVKKTLPGADSPSYNVLLRRFGDPLPGIKPKKIPQNSLGAVIDVTAVTQDLANTVCALFRSRLLHTDYRGRKSTAGNLAFPFSPSDIKAGPVYTFGVYHLAETDDPEETCKTRIEMVGK
jgi:hypothetical protein